MLSVAIARFLDMSSARGGLSPASIAGYRCDLNAFRHFLGADLAVRSIQADQMRRFSRYLTEESGLKLSTVKRRIASVRGFIRWLEREGQIEPGLLLSLDVEIPPAVKPRSLFPHARLYRF